MENLVIQTKKKITLDKFVSSVKVLAQSDVKTVLNVSVTSSVNQIEQSGNIVTYAGKAKVNVIYLNGENQVESAENMFEYSAKQPIQIQLSDMVATDDASVQVDTYDGSEILCSVTHNTHIFGIYKHEIADFVGENTSFVLNKKSVSSQKIMATAIDNFVVAEEQESNILNMQVLSANAKVLSATVSSGVGKVVVDGKLLVETIYKDFDGLSLISREIEFKQEIESSNSMPNMLAELFVDVKNVTVTPEEKQDKTNIVYALDISAKAYIYDETTYEIAADMFSLDSEIQNTYDCLDFVNFSAEKETSDMIMTTTDVSSVQDFDDIVGVYMPKIKIENVYDANEKSYADGKIFAFALYKTENGIKRIEISNIVKFEFEKGVNEKICEAYAGAEISSFKVKAGKDLEVAFKVIARASFIKESTECFVKSFEIKDAKAENSGGIKVYVTKEGETLFEVAKILSVRPEIIEEQNEIDGVFEKGEKIYVYSPANIK